MDVIGFEQGLRIRQKLDREMGTNGVSVNVTMGFDNTEIIKRAIEGGLGVGLLPSPTIDREVQLGLLVAIPVLDESQQTAFKRPLGIIHRRGRNLPIPAQKFIRGLQATESPESAGTAGDTTASVTNTKKKKRTNGSQALAVNGNKSLQNGSAAQAGSRGNHETVKPR